MKHFIHMLSIPIILIVTQSWAMEQAVADENPWKTVCYTKAKKQDNAVKSIKSASPKPKRQSRNKKKYAQNNGYATNKETFNAELPELPSVVHTPIANEQPQYNYAQSKFLNSYNIHDFKAFSVAQGIARTHRIQHEELY